MCCVHTFSHCDSKNVLFLLFLPFFLWNKTATCKRSVRTVNMATAKAKAIKHALERRENAFKGLCLYVKQLVFVHVSANAFMFDTIKLQSGKHWMILFLRNLKRIFRPRAEVEQLNALPENREQANRRLKERKRLISNFD